MPRSKTIVKCSVDNCNDNADSRGLCANHYSRWHKYGRTDKIRRGDKRSHPLYGSWWDRKEYGSLGDEFQDFWKFVESVKERPSKDYYLIRKDNSNPYSPDNFLWQEHLKRKEGESKKDWYARKWSDRQAKNPQMESDRSIRRKFGLNRDQYNEMLNKQNGVCEICKQPETAFAFKTGEIRKLAIDHCHTTGKIRDLLCFSCNGTIGKVKESIELLEAMKQYLIKHSQH